MASKRAFAPVLSVERAIRSASSSRPICSSCRRQLQLKQLAPIAPQRLATRSLSTSASLHKKSSASSKSSRKSPKVDSPNVNEHVPDNKATRNRDDEIDPYDQSELESGIASAIARLKDALTKTRDAGRVTPNMLEALPVELNIKHPDQSKPKGKAETPHHERAKLGDIASVVPKGGRMLQVFAAEEAHVKPLTAAIMASDYSLTPEVDKNNTLLILVPVPPATAETRQQAAQEAKKCFDKASLDVRNARGDAQKRFRKMELNKLVIQDELKKAHKGMEDVARKGQDEVKRVYENALKTLQQ
ncbi:ribosome-recycling factor [Exophiala xenobiotica]|uniref:Ribosome-recycling factor n=1 Tax=Lithohypha guttulata TaxID=1690604 RepID=A0ABR0K0F8_9EURO|nr:ribosome-recycling factor [Lithohypha guttulata]KAK5322147.1 ribosome-recycling factor [Exophiala xenobiotica]